MARSHASLHRLSAAAALYCLAAVPLPLLAQPHIQETGEHVLRASTVAAANLPAAMREEHAIASNPNTAVLNITVQRKVDGQLRNVPAKVEVQARNLLGASTTVRVREVTANGMVSYLGVYQFLPREVLDFRITARPSGSHAPLTLEFRDRLTGGQGAQSR